METAQDEMKERALKKFSGLLYLRQSDQKRYGHLLKEWCQQYANGQRDLYSKDLSATFKVMRTVEIKKTKKEQPKQEKEKVELPEGAESFSQTTKDEEIICFCCGKPGEYANECPMQKQIAENNWFKNTNRTSNAFASYRTKSVDDEKSVDSIESGPGPLNFARGRSN